MLNNGRGQRRKFHFAEGGNNSRVDRAFVEFARSWFHIWAKIIDPRFKPCRKGDI